MLVLTLSQTCSEQNSSTQTQVMEGSIEAIATEYPSVEITQSNAEVIVLTGLDQTIDWLKAEDWWGEPMQSEQLSVPRALITNMNRSWQEISRDIPVATKKAVFYRVLLPLIMHANTIVIARRDRLEQMQQQLLSGSNLPAADLQWLAEICLTLRVIDASQTQTFGQDSSTVQTAIEEALYRIDVVPAGLALGQAAYESGYGTSRFATQGNALFGQWDFDNKGITPLQQRTELGDYRVASFDWPFDSVRSYFINLSRHPAYEEFRRLRAEMRTAGQALDSLKLAEGLSSYSEQGQEYVKTLQGIIRVNNLAIADDAVFRDEPLRFLVHMEDEADASNFRSALDVMRESGLLAEVIERMNLY